MIPWFRPPWSRLRIQEYVYALLSFQEQMGPLHWAFPGGSAAGAVFPGPFPGRSASGRGQGHCEVLRPGGGRDPSGADR